jgi:DNA-binding CsgD family transcriptional regulator
MVWGMAPVLVQRSRQVEEIDGLLAAAPAGSGRVALVSGSAGLGKTTLLHEATRLARLRGMRVLAARGGELEREMSFGVVRPLFEDALAALEGSDRATVLSGPAQLAVSATDVTSTPSGADPMGVIHGLYWLTVNLADLAPLLLVIDDAHWADAQSLRWLVYLAARITAAPLVVLVAARTDEHGAERSLLDALIDQRGVSRIALEHLDGDGVGELVSAELGSAPDRVFVSACHAATAGNPFFVRELLRAAVQNRIRPEAVYAPLVARLSTQEIERSILTRLDRLGGSARRLAEAVAVLDSDAQVRHAALLCGLSLDDALVASDVLIRAEILRDARPLNFIHPIVRATVYGQLPAGERSRRHRRAAELLAREGSTPEQIASHVLACEPGGDPVVVSWLRDAAHAAVSSSALESAGRYLRRALIEPPDRELRPVVAFELGKVLAGVDVAEAAECFTEAARGGDASVRLLANRWRGQTLCFSGRPAEAVAAVEQELALQHADPELTLLLAATRDFYALGWTGDPDWAQRSARLQDLAANLEGATPGERRVLATASIDIARTGAAPSARAYEFAGRVRRALATWLDADDGVETAAAIGNSGILCDDPEGLARHERAIAEAARRGRITNVGAGNLQLAEIRFRLGAPPLVPIARGQLALAQGQVQLGIELLMDDGDWLESRGWANPSLNPWRAHVAPALAMAGRIDDAREVIGPAVVRAREFGSPWALGMALRAAGTVEQGKHGIALLQEAIRVLEPARCRVEHAHALLELGAIFRRRNQRSEARQHLRVALDLAHRCGARPLADRARDELAATGARPRRLVLSGADALTASERRVAKLAIDGLSNREIAQTLFITRKTVEAHVSHIFSKLDVSSREQLAGRLADTTRGLEFNRS